MLGEQGIIQNGKVNTYGLWGSLEAIFGDGSRLLCARIAQVRTFSG